MPLLDLEELRQVGVVAVHAVHALDGHDDAPVPAPHVAQQLVQGAGVIVRKRPPRSLRQARALGDAVVGQFVVQDQVFLAEQVPKQRRVGAVPAGKYDAASVPRNWASSSSNSSRIEWLPPTSRLAERCSQIGRSRPWRRRSPGMSGQAQVVEARVAHDFAAPDRGHPLLDSLVGAEKRVL